MPMTKSSPNRMETGGFWGKSRKTSWRKSRYLSRRKNKREARLSSHTFPTGSVLRDLSDSAVLHTSAVSIGNAISHTGGSLPIVVHGVMSGRVQCGTGFGRINRKRRPSEITVALASGLSDSSASPFSLSSLPGARYTAKQRKDSIKNLRKQQKTYEKKYGAADSQKREMSELLQEVSRNWG